MKTLLAFLLMATVARAASVTLTWDLNPPEDRVTNYNVVWGNYSGNIKTFNAIGIQSFSGPPATIQLKGTEKYYFRVQAVNDYGPALYSNFVYLNFIRTPANLKFQKIEVR